MRDSRLRHVATYYLSNRGLVGMTRPGIFLPPFGNGSLALEKLPFQELKLGIFCQVVKIMRPPIILALHFFIEELNFVTQLRTYR